LAELMMRSRVCSLELFLAIILPDLHSADGEWSV